MKTILVDAVHCFIVEEKGTFHVFKEMQNLLDSFSNKKIIVTGAEESKFTKYCLDTVPYKVFTLRHNPEKTDPHYFSILLQTFHLTPEDVVYFEHSSDTVKSAQSVGIKTFYYDNAQKDLVALKKFLKANI